jgi:hypothetical protein
MVLPIEATQCDDAHSVTNVCSVASLAVGNRLNNGEIHLGARRNPCDFGGNLGPMEKFLNLTRCSGAGSKTLRLVISTSLILSDEGAGIGLPSPSDFPAAFQPLLQHAKRQLPLPWGQNSS